MRQRFEKQIGPQIWPPSILTKIIYECHKIFISSMKNYRRNDPHITMHNIKAFCSTTTMRRKRKSLTLPSLHTEQSNDKCLETCSLLPNKPEFNIRDRITEFGWPKRLCHTSLRVLIVIQAKDKNL
jgi:hypothetical protein